MAKTVGNSGFVYVWYDQKQKMYYVGSHWGYETDGYVCSSKRMRDNYRNRPHDFKRRIVSRVNTCRRDLLFEEQRWLYMIPDNQLGQKYYNMTKRFNTPWGNTEKLNNEFKTKISEKLQAAFKRPEFQESYKEGRKQALPKIIAITQSEDYRKKAGERSTLRNLDPAYRQAHGEKMTKKHADPEYKKFLTERMNDPEVTAKLSQSNTKAWKDPAIRAKYSLAAKNRDPATRKQSPETIEKKRQFSIQREAIKRQLRIENPGLDMKGITELYRAGRARPTIINTTT
jgi:hypothetical protein